LLETGILIGYGLTGTVIHHQEYLTDYTFYQNWKVCYHRDKQKKLYEIVLYSTSDSQDYLQQVDPGDITYVEQFCRSPDPPVSLEFLDLCRCTMSYFGLNLPQNVVEALDLYMELTHLISLI